MSKKGVPSAPLTSEQRKVFNLLPIDDRPRFLRLLRQREWIAAKRAKDPDKYRALCREWKRAQGKGYYAKGGRGYGPRRSTPKRRAYWVNYNATVRKSRLMEQA